MRNKCLVKRFSWTKILTRILKGKFKITRKNVRPLIHLIVRHSDEIFHHSFWQFKCFLLVLVFTVWRIIWQRDYLPGSSWRLCAVVCTHSWLQHGVRPLGPAVAEPHSGDHSDWPRVGGLLRSGDARGEVRLIQETCCAHWNRMRSNRNIALQRYNVALTIVGSTYKDNPEF